MDKAWKAHERSVAEFFGTRRAIHGIDREGIGEVDTDVFVDFSEWYNSAADKNGLIPLSPGWKWALIVECKFCSKTSNATNDWPIRAVDKVAKSSPDGVMPLVVTRDKWHWIRLKDIPFYFSDIIIGDNLLYYPRDVVDAWNINHIDKKMSKFFLNAFEQANAATIPEDYHKALRIVCVGSNARLPKVVGFHLSTIRTLEIGEEFEE